MFFTAINQMMTEGVDLTLVIRKANGQLAVSTLPKSNGLKDEAQNHIVPLTVNGKPEELDAGFLQTVARPIQKAVGLITNMAQFEVQAEKAASESKAAKDAKAKETKEEKERREKYEKHLKKAEELIAAKNHKDAVTALSQARLHAKPQDQKKIDEMMEQQKKAMNKGSLFELMDEPVPQAQSQPRPQPMAANSVTLIAANILKIAAFDAKESGNSDSNRSHNLWQFPYSNRPIRHSLRYRDPWPDNRNSLRCGHLSNRRTDRFNTRPHHNRNTHSSLPYNRKTMAVRKSRTGRNRNSRLKTTGCNTPQTKKSITIPRITRNIPIFPNPC